MEEFDVVSYTVRVTNSSNGEIIENMMLFNNQTNQKGSLRVNRYHYVLNNNGSIAHDSCHQLLFNVTARNAAGESSGGLINGEFPIGKSG